MTMEFVSANDMRSRRGAKGKTGVRYSGYTEVLAPLVPGLKELIAASKDGTIRMKNKNLAAEMKGAFVNKNPTSLYWGVKSSLFEKGIVVGTGTHKDGDKILTMRSRTPDDILPDSLAKYSRIEVGEEAIVGKEIDDSSDLPEEEDDLEDDLDLED